MLASIADLFADLFDDVGGAAIQHRHIDGTNTYSFPSQQQERRRRSRQHRQLRTTRTSTSVHFSGEEEESTPNVSGPSVTTASGTIAAPSISEKRRTRRTTARKSSSAASPLRTKPLLTAIVIMMTVLATFGNVASSAAAVDFPECEILKDASPSQREYENCKTICRRLSWEVSEKCGYILTVAVESEEAAARASPPSASAAVPDVAAATDVAAVPGGTAIVGCPALFHKGCSACGGEFLCPGKAAAAAASP